MAGLQAPRPRSTPAKPKTSSRGKKKTSTAATRARLGAAKARKQAVTDTAMVAGELLGSGAVWSAASAWRAAKGQDLKLFKTVDARVVAGLAGLVAGLWWPKTKWSSHAVNLSLGTLGSWVHEYSYEMGNKWGGGAAPAAASSGIVLGEIDEEDDLEGADEDETGFLGRRARLRRIERRLARLRRRRARIMSRMGMAPEEGGAQGDMVTVPAWAVRPGYRRQLG